VLSNFPAKAASLQTGMCTSDDANRSNPSSLSMLVDDVHFNALDPVSTHTNEFRNVDGAV
jgi:hypothetical protein